MVGKEDGGRRGKRIKIEVKRVLSVHASEGDTALKSHWVDSAIGSFSLQVSETRMCYRDESALFMQ